MYSMCKMLVYLREIYWKIYFIFIVTTLRKYHGLNSIISKTRIPVSHWLLRLELYVQIRLRFYSRTSSLIPVIKPLRNKPNARTAQRINFIVTELVN